MKYQSELINEILEVRGHDKSSLHYESECIEAWIEEVEGAYPKLCDYEGEWLNYMVENPIGSFPYETITANPTATVSNVVPYRYKSAILKGSTLVNLLNSSDFVNTDYAYKINDVITVISQNNSAWYNCTIPINNTTQNSTYIMCWDNLTYTHTDNRGTNQLIGVYGFEDSNTQITITATQSNQTTNYLIFTIPSTVVSRVNVRIHAATFTGQQGATTTIKGLKVIEYQEGMENWDIPYFEGMQSVKMPVLTTSNEDDTKTNILSTPEDLELRGIGNVKDELNVATGELTQRIGEIVLDGSENWSVGMIGGNYSRFYYRNSFMINETSMDKHLTNNFVSLNAHSLETEGTWLQQSGNECLFSIKLNNSKLISLDIHGLKQYLSENNLKVQYISKQESIKTVDLTVTNHAGETLSKIKPIEGTMHIKTSGTTINPTAVLEVPVEAITQNLNSFIAEE